MKTKELIRLLNEADLTGETECCVGNEDIFIVYREPAYHDGRLQVLVRDPDNHHYNVVGAKVVEEGSKITIRTLSVLDAVWEDPDLPVDLSGLSSGERERWEESIAKQRKESVDCSIELELENFIEWVTKQVGDDGRATEAAKKFFFDNLSYKDKIPADIPTLNQSYVSRRHLQWDRELEVIVEGQLIVRRK